MFRFSLSDPFHYFYSNSDSNVWWIPKYNTVDCASTLSQYRSSHTAQACYEQISCILGHANEDAKANMASATVLLGLAPSTLAAISPTAAEMALLSSQRPILTLLLAVGAPTVHQTRVATYDDPVRGLKNGLKRKEINSLGRYLPPLISSLEYAIAAAAAFHNIVLALDLGIRTVLNWKCTLSILPLVWILFGASIHMIAALSFHFSNAKRSIKPQGVSRKSKSPLVRFWARELTTCWNMDECTMDKPDGGESKYAIFLNWLASGLGLAHVIFGTLVLSSLLFIGVIDALYVILRLIGTTFICRLILQGELAGLQNHLTLRE